LFDSSIYDELKEMVWTIARLDDIQAKFPGRISEEEGRCSEGCRMEGSLVR
jgi:hypothetical protein